MKNQCFHKLSQFFSTSLRTLLQFSQPAKGPRMQKGGPGDFGRTDVSIRLATTIEVERQVFIEPITDAADNKERAPIFGARMGDGGRFHVDAGDFFIA